MNYKETNQKIPSPFSYNLIYVYEIRDEDHKNCLKIGKASLTTTKQISIDECNTEQLNKAADERIREQTRTAGIKAYCLHTEIAIKEEIKHGDKNLISFLDDDVHEVLINSGIKRVKFDLDSNPREWFNVNLETAKAAIKAVKEGRKSLNNSEINTDFSPIVLYPNQEEAVNKTLKNFKKNNNMLWDAKMRFGKTITALELIKRINKQPEVYGEINKVIIATHKPDVIDQWFGDFKSIFYEKDSKWHFGSKVKGFGLPIEDLVNTNENIICFASLQDLRGATQAGGKFVKNKEIYDVKWDLLIIDEAHEGTLTERGESVVNELIDNSKEHKTKVLRLSGTPFNIIDQYDKDSIYSWSYIDEQEHKNNWDYFKNPTNPYAKMPKMNVFTYDLGTLINNPHYLDDKMFNFSEFFRVWTGKKEDDLKDVSKDEIGKFVHEQDVVKFLNLLSKEDESNNYPFSTKEYQNFFKHTLWMVPGVKEAAALSKLLKQHETFKNFEIVNVAGDGDEEQEHGKALNLVRKAIKKHEYTITLSCQRLTTGVTIPEWTAVFMLYGSSQVAAQRYMQTIFRVQSPANIDGRLKENCFVFEFAPDRALKVLARTAHLSHQAGKVNSPETKMVMEKFLKFCPVIAINGSRMEEYNVPMMIKQLKAAYIDDIVDSGFENKRIYNLDQLRLENINPKDFEGCKEILKGVSDNKKSRLVDIVKNDLDKKEKSTTISDRPAKTPEQKESEKQARNAIKILNAIMTKVPLMVYGLTLTENKPITYDNFTDLIDDESWGEFMPKDATKERFKLFKKYIDIEMFELCNEELRNQINAFNKLSVNERIKRLTPLFLKFKNPDKETVLTPWRVVNMHLGDCIGGYNFYNEDYSVVLEEPRFIDQGKVTNDLLKNTDVKVLEINSKTGLYPLYLTYSLFRHRLSSPIEMRTDKQLWKETVEKNIYVVCRTKMAEKITRRTLIGDDINIKTNILTINNMIEQLKNKPEDVVSQIQNKSEWKINEGGKMKFDAIVGNPPYQENDKGSNKDSNVSRTSAVSVYQHFVSNSKKISDRFVSIIMPSRWMTGGRGLDAFREENIKDTKFATIHDYVNDQEVFPNTDIGGGIMYFLWDKEHSGKLSYYLHDKNSTTKNIRFLDTGDNIVLRDYNSAGIIKKVNSKINLSSIVSSRKPFGLSADVTRKDPKMFSETISENNSILFYAWDGVPIIRYANKKVVPDNELLKKWKVFISKTADPPIRFGRENKDILRKPFIGKPYSACSETYLTIGCCETEQEANAILKYVKTKFVRFLVLQKKKTQNVSKEVFAFVPLQDFTINSDIKWERSINEIDNQLYKKYKLTEEDIRYIEIMINPME